MHIHLLNIQISILKTISKPACISNQQVFKFINQLTYTPGKKTLHHLLIKQKST
jgi:hypothetical protein